jgi:amino-acid N-acetyltransferase
MNIRKAKISDVEQMRLLVNFYADKGLMLKKSLNDFYENIRDFYIAEEENTIIACCALHPSWADLAEIKSLAVEDKQKGKGIGSKLVELCLQEAKEIGMKRVFVLTYRDDFFKKFGFKPIVKEELPHKIWNECVNCPKFPDCDEIALITDL